MLVLLFAITAGLTLSGIIANIYRILAPKPQSRGGTALYYGIMVLAGAISYWFVVPLFLRPPNVRRESTGAMELAESADKHAIR